MNQNKDTPKSRLLHSHGWDGCAEARLLRATDNWVEAPEFRSHGHALRRLFEDIGIDAVVCIEGRPTVCLKDGRQLSDTNVEEIRKKLWNLGATTLLVIEQRSEVRVFSTLVSPSQEDHQGTSAQLTTETIERLEAAELALRLQQFVRRVETGAIYREHKALFNPKQSVDQLLLENLRAARDLICPEKSVDGYRRAHALIGKFLFSCYLLDRGIIGPAYLRENGLPEASNILGLLSQALVYRSRILESLFHALQRDFNGSLFGDQVNSTFTDEEVDYLLRLLSGENLRKRQPSLFRLYDFSFIPVELISSIYQEFLGAEAEAGAQPTRKNQLRNHGQRTQGAYYTPPRLAELAMDIATEGWATLLDKRCLDPACGSGIFLVILFVRMAEEWRKRNPNASTERRYNELMRLLAENLRGVDINLTACLVTCFSLYLAFLDQMEPKEIMELREALERDMRKKLLPRILWEQSKSRPRLPHLDTIRELNFFEMQAEPEFDLVVGNPPWVSRKDAPLTEAWLFSERHNPVVKEITKAERRQTLFPAKEVACAFMWKAGLHVHASGRVCQVLPSRVFLSNNTDRFQAAWLKRHRIETIWLLADYRFVLFPSADCPCFIGRYHPRRSDETLGEFEFITPKVELLDPREALIPVQPEDQKVISEVDIVAAAERNKAAFAWKQHHWGTARDIRLIERLIRLPKLDVLCARPPRMKRDTPGTRSAKNKKRWWKGAGFQPLTESDLPEEGGDENQTTWPIWWDKRQAFLAANAAPDSLFLDRAHCEPYGNRPIEVRRTIAPELCRPPLLLVNKASTKSLFSDFSVLFQDNFQSICAPKNDEDELLFLTAVLASPLAQYLFLHTTAVFGIERHIARLEEILELPFPLPGDMPNQERSRAIVRECAGLLRNLKRKLPRSENLLNRGLLEQETRKKLDALVYDYYGICEWERYLIEDTVEMFRPSSTPGSLDSENLVTAQPSQLIHRRAYANTLVSTFRGWTRSKASLWIEGYVAAKPGLAMVTLGVGDRARGYQEAQAEEHIEEVLKKIRKSSTLSKGTVFSCLRGFAFYEGAKVHLLKPLSRRHWTRTAALNDADEILIHMMKEDGWGA
jgi:Eco57I restriction-modification methylase